MYYSNINYKLTLNKLSLFKNSKISYKLNKYTVKNK